jgi:hypothetical protein
MLPNARISQLGCRNVTGGHLNLLAVAGFARGSAEWTKGRWAYPLVPDDQQPRSLMNSGVSERFV